MSQVDQKRAFNKLKHDLEAWRELIVLLDSFVKWEKTYYPGIVFGATSILYLMLWYMNLSTLTLVSLCGLCAVVFDYGYGILSHFLFHAENWTGSKENQFEEVCNEICATKMKLYSLYTMLFAAKEKKSAMFLIVMSSLLLGLAWIGSVIDNLFLSYMTSLFLVMYPGLQRHGFVGTVKSRFGNLITSKINKLKDGTNKTD